MDVFFLVFFLLIKGCGGSRDEEHKVEKRGLLALNCMRILVCEWLVERRQVIRQLMEERKEFYLSFIDWKLREQRGCFV